MPHAEAELREDIRRMLAALAAAGFAPAACAWWFGHQIDDLALLRAVVGETNSTPTPCWGRWTMSLPPRGKRRRR